jgi:hypothetical protein
MANTKEIINFNKKTVINFFSDNKENLFFSLKTDDISMHGGDMVYISNKQLSDEEFESAQIDIEIVDDIINQLQELNLNEVLNLQNNSFQITFDDYINFDFNDTEASDFILVA